MQVIVNKSRAQWRALVTKIPMKVDDLDKIPQISNDIKSMLKSNPKVFLGKEAPYCFLSRIETSFAELTLGCNLKHMVNSLSPPSSLLPFQILLVQYRIDHFTCRWVVFCLNIFGLCQVLLRIFGHQKSYSILLICLNVFDLYPVLLHILGY